MAQLIKLNLLTRNKVAMGGLATAFDIDDIIIPIRQNGAGSYFSARMQKGTVVSARDLTKVDYLVSQTLAQMAALSSKLLLLSVSQRRSVTINNEFRLFDSSRISETINPGLTNTFYGGSQTGSMFYYCEDGDPLPVQYYVNETIDQIIAMDTAIILPAPTEISYTIGGGTTNINLAPYSGELIIDVQGSGAQSLTSFSNYSAVTKVTLRPISGLTLTVSDNPAGGIKLNAPTVVVYGSNFGYLKLTQRANKFFETGYIDQYN